MDDDDEKDYQRIRANARLVDDLLNEIVKGFYAGEFVGEKEYWQGKKDGLRLAISLLRPHLPGAWVSSLRSSPGAVFLESEEKMMDVA